MLISFKCKKCGCCFSIKIDTNEQNEVFCPQCKTSIPYNQLFLFDKLEDCLNLLERYQINFEVYNINLGTENFNHFFDEDIHRLKSLYYLSNPEVQNFLSDVIDKLYLLIYNTAKFNNLDGLKFLKDEFNQILEKRRSNKDFKF